MSAIDAHAAVPCPNCRQTMQGQDLERHDHGAVRVHLCFACAGIWFDHLGSVQLAPAAVIELFKEIYSHRDDERRPVASRLGCPRCRGALALSYDLSKSGRFSYFSCHHCDGRFTPFFQFLREKQFVRSLTAPELKRIRAEVRQITCSECGAPIDLEHDSVCKHCQAPVSYLDSEAVEKAVQMWSQADHRRHPGPAAEALDAALLRTPPHPARDSPRVARWSERLLLTGRDGDPVAGVHLAPDLVAWGIHAIGRLFELATED